MNSRALMRRLPSSCNSRIAMTVSSPQPTSSCSPSAAKSRCKPRCRARSGCDRVERKLLAAKRSERSGPRLKAAMPVADRLCSVARKVDASIFARQNRRQRCAFVVLRRGLHAMFRQRCQGFRQQRRSHRRQPRSQRHAGVFGADRHLPLQQNVSRVQSLVDAHGGVAGYVLTVAMAHWIGAAPRYFGSSEACRLMLPCAGRSSIQRGMMRP